MYSTKTELAKQVCDILGFNFEVQFVKVCRHGGKIFVRGGLGKPNEHSALHRAAESKGFEKRPPIGRDYWESHELVSVLPEAELAALAGGGNEP